MRNVFKFVYLAVLAITFTAIAVFAQQYSSGNDTYNFYFQKAPGPATVIQGSGAQQPPPTNVIKEGEVVQTAPTAVSNPVAQSLTPAPTATEQANAAKKWSIYGGYGSIVSNPSSHQYINARGYSFGLTYNVSKYFGAGVSATYAGNVEFTNALSKKRTSPWDTSAQIVVTPIHMQLFGYDFISIGAVGGVMTAANDLEYKSDNEIEEKKHVVAFLGPRVTMNINPTVGVIGEWRFQAGDSLEKNSQFTGGLSINF